MEDSTLNLRILGDTLAVVWDMCRLHRMEKATKPREDEFRNQVGTTIERTLTGEARMDL